MEEVVSKEVAVAAVNKWLDEKKIKSSVRELHTKNIDLLVAGVMDGDLHIDEKNNIVHKLAFPIVADVTTDTLTYKPRLNVDETTEGIKNFDGTGGDLILSYVVLLTGKVKGIIKKLDSSTDYKICQAVASFFI